MSTPNYDVRCVELGPLADGTPRFMSWLLCTPERVWVGRSLPEAVGLAVLSVCPPGSFSLPDGEPPHPLATAAEGGVL